MTYLPRLALEKLKKTGVAVNVKTSIKTSPKLYYSLLPIH